MKRFIGKFLVVTLVFLILTSISFAYQENKQTKKAQILQDEKSLVTGFPGPFNSAVHLDEQIGDTFSVGYTWRDMQHNCTFGRMIGVEFDSANPDSMIIHVIWTGREGTDENSTVLYNKVSFNENNQPYISHEHTYGRRVDAGGDNGFGGYTVLSMMDNSHSFIGYHGDTGPGSDYISVVSAETSFMEFFFNPKHEVPFLDDAVAIWPHMAVCEYNGTQYQHVVMNPTDDSDYAENIYYARTQYDGSVFSDVSPGGATQLVSNRSVSLSNAIVASQDGSLVTIGAAASRWIERGKIPSGWDGFSISQSDNDLLLWTSTDGGATWDWDSPLNITNFYDANPDYLPDDTTSANQDTIRSYSELEMIYDDEDVLHCAFNTTELDYYRRTTTQTGRLYYWNSDDQTFSMIADGTHWNYAGTRPWEVVVSIGGIEKDADGIIWALYSQCGEPGDTIVRNDTIYSLDVSESGYANTDLYVTCSPDNGRRWTKGVNITNTRTMDYDLHVGDSRAETEHSLAPYVDGEYLHIFYTLDFDPGICVPSGDDDQGFPTRNQQVYQRVSKQVLKDMFTEYLPNYPLHIDSTGSYIDQDDWVWDDPFASGVETGETLTPDQFELEQNYPNPFNPTTQIAFNLKQQGMVKLAVYDILGREIATLINRNLEAGTHNVTFMGDELPSGDYFYKLSSGSASQVRKMVLMK